MESENLDLRAIFDIENMSNIPIPKTILISPELSGYLSYFWQNIVETTIMAAKPA